MRNALSPPLAHSAGRTRWRRTALRAGQAVLAIAIGLAAASPPVQAQTGATARVSGLVSGAGRVRIDPGAIECQAGVQCGASFPAGTPVTLTALPSSASLTPRWIGPCFSADTACSFTLGADTRFLLDFGGGLSSPPPTGTPTLTRTVLVSGLVSPWEIAFAPDRAMFFTERGRGLSVRLPNGTQRLLYGPAGAAVTAADLVALGQSGLCGLALDPDFATNRTLYVYVASNLGGTLSNRVRRLVLDSGYTTVVSSTDLVTGIPIKATELSGDPSGLGAHSGGRLRFGPDGYLYVTTGDNHRGLLPQDLTQLGGKVLRIDHRTGAAAPGNATPAGGDARIFAWGFRNVQGLTFVPRTGQPVISEHGPGHTDEVTLLRAGGNGGWDPVCLNGVNYCGYTSNQANGSVTPMTDLVKFPKALVPIWTNDGLSQGMSASAFLHGYEWRDWNGALVVSYMAGRRLDVLRLNADGSVQSRTRVFNTLGVRLRAVTMGPDGALYVSTDGKSGGDEIWRVTAQ